MAPAAGLIAPRAGGRGRAGLRGCAGREGPEGRRRLARLSCAEPGRAGGSTPACLLACLPACLPACLRACVLACLRACVLACLRACLLACLLANFHSEVSQILHVALHVPVDVRANACITLAEDVFQHVSSLFTLTIVAGQQQSSSDGLKRQQRSSQCAHIHFYLQTGRTYRT